MLNLRRIGLFSMPLRAAFALLFLIFTMVQPAMFASAGSDGVGHGLAMKVDAAAAPSVQGAHDHEHAVGHVHGGANDDGSSSQKQASDSVNKNCEVHCAPVHAMPVACPDIAANFARCFAPITSDLAKTGENTDHIRPPRRLI
jgi:hypothetical protein